MQADELRSDNRATNVDADVDPTDGRDESVNERMDRNWNEILQELRVTQTGTQIFTGFLLTIAFQTGFSDLTTFQTRVYLVLVVAAVLTTALGLAPVNLHRACSAGAQRIDRSDRTRHHALHPYGRRRHVDRHCAVDLRPGDGKDCRACHGRLHPCCGDHHRGVTS